MDGRGAAPRRRHGTACGHGQGLWGLALGPNGPYGTLHEGSDAFGGNDAAGRVDFVSPTLVAGDIGWSNYVLSTRVLPSDDDGHGVLLRYRNETNLYRIALRFQSSGVGARKGLSVQKVVDGIFEEIYFESPVSNYDPTPGAPYELLAAINGHELQIVVVGDPDGARRTFFYGPINMAGNNGLTIDQGKVGVFSWAMTMAQFDFVRVERVEGVPLLVASSFGPAHPPVGLNDFAAASEITASVPAVVEEQPGIRRIPTGFAGLGSVPASGSTNRLTFTLDSLSFINWQWRTEYRLTAMAAAGGTVVAPAEQWQPEGSAVIVLAQPNAGYLFAGWSGNSFSADASLSFPMTRPVSLTAHFVADTDGDGLADPFEQTYFANLDQGAAGDPDNDGRTNLTEYQQGTDPTFAEMPVATDGLSSTVENVQRDPVLPGQFITRDFAQGFRGAWEVSNDFRGADDPTIIGATSFVPNVSFDGPRLVIRNEAWDPDWSTNSTAQVIFTVGDNDGNCVYWRYQNESNWYRVTVCGEDNSAVWRAPLGVSIQKRIGNVFSQLASDAGIFTDPDDGTDPGNIAGWKRIRVTIITDGPNHTVTVEGWDARAMSPDWSAASTVILMFTDGDLLDGRLGFGSWGQGADPASATAEIPVDDGMLIEDVRIEGATTNAFHEDWSTAPLVDEFPAGWSNAYAGQGGPELGWRMSAHGTIFQVSNFAPLTSSRFGQPSADADGPILLGPSPGVANYVLEVGFHPFDDDAIGFVYDYQDQDNFARVLFVSQPSGDGRIPQGLNVTRKSAGVWTDIIAEDLSFIYQPGHPFAIRFANNNGTYRLFAWELDNPGTVYSWTWTDQRARPDNQFGLATWGEVDGHFLHARAFGLPELTLPELRILGIRLDSGMVTLDVLNTTGQPYAVEVTPSLGPPAWTPAATAQTSDQWTGPAPIGAAQAFYRLVGE